MGRGAALPISTRTSTCLCSGLAALVAVAALLAAPRADAASCGEGQFHAEVVQQGDTWTAPGYSGPDMLEAMRAGVASLTPGRTSKESVVVRGSGTVPADQSLDLPSHTLLEVCGTIHVAGTPTGANAPVRGQHVTDVEVTQLSVTGNPYFAVYFANAEGVTLGEMDLRLSGGLGIRIDNYRDKSTRTRNIVIRNVYVEGSGSHGVETFGVDGLTIGTVTARNTGESGLLLNDTINARVDLVDAENTGSGTGYAAFRTANRSGRINDAYPTNIHVGQVIARGGGRGVFCVSESGGVEIGRVDISGTETNAVLIENCTNVTLATEGGTVAGPGDIRLAARDDFAGNRDVTLANLTLVDTALNEQPCAENTTLTNITWQNTQDNSC